MPPFTGREYDWQAGQCAFRMAGCHEANQGKFICKNCWASADLHQQEDLKLAYPPGQFCHGFSCWEVPLLGPDRVYYCQKCTRNPNRSRSPSMNSSGRRPSEASTATDATACGTVRLLIPGQILREMEEAPPAQIEAMITYAARLLRQQ